MAVCKWNVGVMYLNYMTGALAFFFHYTCPISNGVCSMFYGEPGEAHKLKCVCQIIQLSCTLQVLLELSGHIIPQHKHRVYHKQSTHFKVL